MCVFLTNCVVYVVAVVFVVVAIVCVVEWCAAVHCGKAGSLQAWLAWVQVSVCVIQDVAQLTGGHHSPDHTN